MKKKALIAIALFSAGLLIGSALFLIQQKSHIPHQTYVKKESGPKQHKTTPEELKAINQQQIELPTQKETATIGTGEVKNFVNAPNKKWKQNLGAKLLRFQKPETKVVVTEKRSIVEKKRGSARHLEEVIVTFINTDGRINGFSAIVDGESGEIIRTWGRVIHEKKEGKIKMPAEGYKYSE